MRKAIRA